MPTLSAYRKNTVSLDTATLGENVDVEQSGLTLIPTSGAVVLANYKTHIGYRVLFSCATTGEPLPFGAQAEVVEQNRHSANRSMVADGGSGLPERGVPERGTLRVTWYQDEEQQQCQTPFRLGKLIWPPASPRYPLSATRGISCVVLFTGFSI